MKTGTIILAVLTLILLSGCTQREYVCADGQVVSNPNQCNAPNIPMETPIEPPIESPVEPPVEPPVNPQFLDCGSDIDCFSERLKYCEPAIVTIPDGNKITEVDTYSYFATANTTGEIADYLGVFDICHVKYTNVLQSKKAPFSERVTKETFDLVTCNYNANEPFSKIVRGYPARIERCSGENFRS